MNDGLELIDLGPIEIMRALRSQQGPYGASRAALAALAQLTTGLRVSAGAQLTRENGPVGTVYFVIDGALRVLRRGKRIGDYSARSAVGIVAALAHDARGFDTVALADSTLLALRADDLLEVVEDHFELMHGALRRTASTGIAMRRSLMPHAGFSNEIHEAFEPATHPLDLVERLLRMRAIFGPEASIDELAQIARVSEEVRYPAGTILWSIGDRASHQLLVLSGVVEGVTAEGATSDGTSGHHR